MKKILAATLMLAVGTAHAQWDFNNSPSRVFDMKLNVTAETKVEIRYVKNSDIQTACDAQSRAFGYNGFPKGAMACTWFWNDRCVMILPEKVDMRTVGHEFLHCLQGNWHKE